MEDALTKPKCRNERLVVQHISTAQREAFFGSVQCMQMGILAVLYTKAGKTESLSAREAYKTPPINKIN
jgi:hypothetical protein